MEEDEYNRYKFAIENIHDIIWELDKNLNFTFVSPNAMELSGYEPKEMVGRNLLEFLNQESKDYIAESFIKYQKERIAGTLKKPFLYDVEFVRKDGEVIWFEVSAKPIFKSGLFAGYIGMSRDISSKMEHENEVKKYIAELEHANKKLDRLATLDILTGVYNRRKFELDVTLAVDRKEKLSIPFAVVMFDIDGFKQVNDQYGHKMGDVILQKIAATVQQLLRKTDTLFRWGGDEFVILLNETSLKMASQAAEKIRETIETFDFELENESVTISLGVGEYNQCDSLDQFLSHVDNALFKAKSNGKNRVEYIIAD